MALEDNEGNVLGPRGTYVYETNTGVSFNMSLDRSVSDAVGNALSQNGALPVATSGGTIPFSPRYILVRSADEPSKRKKIVIGDPANSLYASAAAASVTINGEVFNVTGRVGEKSRVLPIDPPPAP